MWLDVILEIARARADLRHKTKRGKVTAWFGILSLQVD